MSRNEPSTVERRPSNWCDAVVHKCPQIYRCRQIVPRSAKEAFAIRDGACIGVWRLPKEAWAWHLMTRSRRTYANNPRVGNICTISISRCVSQISALPGGYPTATPTVGKSNVFEPTGFHLAFLATEKSIKNHLRGAEPK